MNTKLSIPIGVAACVVGLMLPGCGFDSGHTSSRNYALTDMQVDVPKEKSTFEQKVTGGQLFKMYCSSCHNGRPLAERNFRATEAAFNHMRTQTYLTGEEYRKLIHYLRRWHDLGPPVPEDEPGPKRFFFAQPIMELKPNSAAADSTHAEGLPSDAAQSVH